MQCPQCVNKNNQMSQNRAKKRWRCWICGFERPFSKDLDKSYYLAYLERKRMLRSLN